MHVRAEELKQRLEGRFLMRGQAGDIVGGPTFLLPQGFGKRKKHRNKLTLLRPVPADQLLEFLVWDKTDVLRWRYDLCTQVREAQAQTKLQFNVLLAFGLYLYLEKPVLSLRWHEGIIMSLYPDVGVEQ